MLQQDTWIETYCSEDATTDCDARVMFASLETASRAHASSPFSIPIKGAGKTHSAPGHLSPF